MSSGDMHPSKRDRVRLQSVELVSDELDEVDSLYDVAEPAYALVYRTRYSGTQSAAEPSVRIVSCVKAEIEDRFTKRIFGKLEEFVTAVTYLVDSDGNEQTQALDIPSCCVFDDPPSAGTARSVIQQNRTLIRHFAPVLDVDDNMNLLYERQLFKIRCGPRSAGAAEGRHGRRGLSRNRLPLGTGASTESISSEFAPHQTAASDLDDDHGTPVGRGGQASPGDWSRKCSSPFEAAATAAGHVADDPNPPTTMARSRSLQDPSEIAKDGHTDQEFLYSTMPTDGAAWQGVANQDYSGHQQAGQPGADYNKRYQQEDVEEGARYGVPSGREDRSGSFEDNYQQYREQRHNGTDIDKFGYKDDLHDRRLQDSSWTPSHEARPNYRHQGQYLDEFPTVLGPQPGRYQDKFKSEVDDGQFKHSSDGQIGDYHTYEEDRFDESRGPCRENMEPPPSSPVPYEDGPELHKKTFADTGSKPEAESMQHLPQGQNHNKDSGTGPPVSAPATDKGAQSKFTMEVDPRETVGSLKQKIWKSRGYPPNVQRLVFNGAILSDKMRLADCDVTEDSTLVLWLLLGRGRAVRIG